MATPADAAELPEIVVQALALLASGDHPAALALLNAHLLEFPTCERGYCARGSTRREAGQLNEALQDFHAALALRPTYARAVFGRGLAKFDTKDHEGAFADFATAVAIEPEAGFFYYWGERLAHLERHAEAVDRFTECLNRSDTHVLCLLSRALSQAKLGDVSASIVDLERAASLAPTDFRVHVRLGGQLERAERYDRAARSFDRAIELSPPDGTLHFRRGCVLYKNRDHEAALRDFTKALALNHDPESAYHWRGRALLELDDDGGAAADLTRAIALNPSNDDAFRARGDAYLALDEPALALADFTRACELNPSQADAWVRRARAHLQQEDEGAALADLDHALLQEPQNKAGLRMRSALHAVRGSHQLAEADLDALANVAEKENEESSMAQRQLRTSVLLAEHFGETTTGDLAITQRQFPYRVRADLQRAMDELFANAAATHFSGVKKEHAYHGVAFSDLLYPTPHQPALAVPAEYEEVDIGESAPVRCLKNGLWLAERGGLRYAVFVSPANRHGEEVGLNFQIAAPQGEAGALLTQETFKLLEEAVLRSQSYRGKILSLEEGDRYSGKSSGIRVHKLRTVEREQVILPAATIELLDRNVVQFARQRARLGELGLSTKKGLLFYGPPGTGKTHTIHYLAGAMEGHTTLLISAEQVGLLGEYMTLARLLQPSIVVIEDADLIARDRNAMESVCEEVLLNKLLNEMDGLRPDTDVLFILTTNRPEALEGALASRPGRIDQAIEFPLPDETGRRKLVHLYARGLKLPDEVVETAVRRTERVSASFIKELMRRAAQFLIEREGDSTLSVADLDRALDELLFAGGSLNCRLLGLQESAG